MAQLSHCGLMTDEQKYRWLTRFFVWQCVICLLVGWNVTAFSEEWTNWNILSIAGQAILLFCVHRQMRRFHVFIAQCIKHFTSQ